MKRIVMALSIFVVCASPAVAKAANTDPTPIVFTHVSVVPMDGDRILPDQDVIIRGKLIASHEQVVPGPIHEVFRTKSKRDLVATKRQLKSNLDRTESTLRAVDDVLRVRSQHAPS